MDEASAEGSQGERTTGERLRGRPPIPLNSKRLTVAHMKRLARSLGLPTTAAGDEIRQMVEGKLADAGREPRNVLVRLGSGAPGFAFVLQDEEGEFLTVEEEVEEEPPEPAISEHQHEAEEIQTLRAELEAVQVENTELRYQLDHEKARFRGLWQTNCQCLAEYDEMLAQKDMEIERLGRPLLEADRTSLPGDGRRSEPRASESNPHEPVSGTGRQGRGMAQRTGCGPRRGKAPPVDPFTGEEPEIRLDDWLPSLKRAATWNEWTERELLLQLAGHLRGRALQEWSLLEEASRETYQTAVESLRLRIDPSSRTLAAQDFRHITQGEREAVADFIRRLERTFRVAYGHDQMSAETRSTLLHGQLQEGLQQEVMHAPAVSGAQTYQELCLASRNEEKRLAELRKRQQYQKTSVCLEPHQPRRGSVDPRGTGSFPAKSSKPSETRKCYLCHKAGHLARDCRVGRTESGGRKDPRAGAKHVTSKRESYAGEERQAVLDLLFSSDEESHAGVSTIRVKDQGSQPQCVRVEIQGVPVYGVVDSGADITIIGGKLLRRVAAIVKLRKKDLKRPDKVPRNYDQRPFTLHGRMDLDFTFAGKTMTTPVYIKLDAEEQLLLSEGVCRQLGIIQYHPDVEPWRHRKNPAEGTVPKDSPDAEAVVPTISIKLVQSLRLPPGQCAVVPVQVEGARDGTTLLLEPTHTFERESGLELSDTLLQPSADGLTHAVVANTSGFTQRVAPGAMMGKAEEVTVVDPLRTGTGDSPAPDLPSCEIVRVDTSQDPAARKRRLLGTVGRPELLNDEQTACFEEFLAQHLQAFSLDPDERGETDLVQIKIDTGDASPKRLPVRRMPFAVRQEVAKQLKSMQGSGVIRPSSSPWASPVVMVRKKDGTHRFCIDYRHLNAVTKPDLYPLPRIDDLLDQLGRSRFFSTLDLAAGYWQIRVHPNSIEKTAFITPQGLTWPLTPSCIRQQGSLAPRAELRHHRAGDTGGGVGHISLPLLSLWPLCNRVHRSHCR